MGRLAQNGARGLAVPRATSSMQGRTALARQGLGGCARGARAAATGSAQPSSQRPVAVEQIPGGCDSWGRALDVKVDASGAGARCRDTEPCGAEPLAAMTVPARAAKARSMSREALRLTISA